MILLGFTGFYPVLSSFTGFYWVSLFFSWVFEQTNNEDTNIVQETHVTRLVRVASSVPDRRVFSLAAHSKRQNTHEAKKNKRNAVGEEKKTARRKKKKETQCRFLMAPCYLAPLRVISLEA